MKQTLYFMAFLALFLIGEMVYGGNNYYRNRTNVVLYGGYNANQLNINENSNYQNIYADYLAFMESWSGWAFGPYVTMGRSNFVLNMSQYTSASWETSLGGVTDYYNPNFSDVYQMFGRANLGVKYAYEDAGSLILHGSKKGYYAMRQNDWMITPVLNLNVIKNPWAVRPNFLCRSQILFSGQFPFYANKKSYWNSDLPSVWTDSIASAWRSDSLAPTKSWSKAYLQVIAKETVWRFSMSETYCNLKVLGGYFYSHGDMQKHSFGFGTEISLSKIHRDDFMSLNAMYKIVPGPTSNIFVWGASFNLGSLLGKTGYRPRRR
jgi:hypothetical protein